MDTVQRIKLIPVSVHGGLELEAHPKVAKKLKLRPGQRIDEHTMKKILEEKEERLQEWPPDAP